MDFRWQKNQDTGKSSFVLRFVYEGGRVVLRKSTDYIVYISKSLDDYLKFGSSKPVGSEYVKFENYLNISDYCGTADEGEGLVHIVVNDIIETGFSLDTDGTIYF